MKQRSCGLENIVAALIAVVPTVAYLADFSANIDLSVADAWDSVTLWVEGGETQQLADYWKVKLTDGHISWMSSQPNSRKVIWAIMTSPILKGARGKTYPTFADGVTIKGLLMIGREKKTMAFDKDAMRNGGDGVRQLEDQALLMALNGLQKDFASAQGRSNEEVSLISKVRSGNEIQSELRMFRYEFRYHLKGNMPKSYKSLRDTQKSISKSISKSQQRLNWPMQDFDLQIGLFRVTDKGLEMMLRKDVVNPPLEYGWQIHRGFDLVQASTLNAAELSKKQPWDSDHYLIVSMKETLETVLFTYCERTESGLSCDTSGHIDAEEVDNDRDKYVGYVRGLLQEAVLKKMMRNLMAEIGEGLNVHLSGVEALRFSKFILEVDNFKSKAQRLSAWLRTKFQKLTTVRDEVFARFGTEAGLRLESIKRIMKASDDTFINSRSPKAKSYQEYTVQLQKNWGLYFDEADTNALSELRKRLDGIIAEREKKEQERATYRATVGPETAKLEELDLEELKEQVDALVSDNSATFSDTQLVLVAVRKFETDYGRKLVDLTRQLEPSAYWGRWSKYLGGMLSERVTKSVLGETLDKLDAMTSATHGATTTFDGFNEMRRVISARIKDIESAGQDWSVLKTQIENVLGEDGNREGIHGLRERLQNFELNHGFHLATADKLDVERLKSLLKQTACAEKWKATLGSLNKLLEKEPLEPLDLQQAQEKIEILRAKQSECSDSPDVKAGALEVLDRAMPILRNPAPQQCWNRYEEDHFQAGFVGAAAGEVQKYFACEFCKNLLSRNQIRKDEMKIWHPDKHPVKSLHSVAGLLTDLMTSGFKNGAIHPSACKR